MSDRQPQPALREWCAQMTQPRLVLVLVAVAAVLAIAGPFQTEELLRLPARAVYWLITIFASYGIGLWVSILTAGRLGGLPLSQRILIDGILTGAGVSLAVMAVNYAAFAWLPDRADLPAFLGTIFAIAIIVTGALQLASAQPAAEPSSAEENGPAPPRLLDRLPPGKRGPLVSISVEDHYVRVRTKQGEEMLLLRLTDAIAETAPTPGVKVHRSHWVATEAISAATRRGDGAILQMTTGPDIPVSRANVPKLKGAGLL